MFVDSHCHLDFPELAGDLPAVLEAMRGNAVTHALVVAVEMAGWDAVQAMARAHPNLYASAGVHPDHAAAAEPTREALAAAGRADRVVAIGETGLDYYRAEGDCGWQRERFRTHIRAARDCGRPLIVHTRSAAEDTLAILREEGAGEVGGVMHCFTETLDVACAAMDLGFHISFSGIVTFRNATALREVAKAVPLERMLIETDSPYLAPVPMRGKRNQPAYVRHVAEGIATLRGIAVEEVGRVTSDNFFRLFDIPRGSVQ
jgi:TatD DNase family protein